MSDRIRNNSNRKKAAKRERIIMLTTSAFVMAALTMTGIYLKNQSTQEQNDGYSIDLAELETNVEDKYKDLSEGIEFAEGMETIPDSTVIENTEDGSTLANASAVENALPLPDEEMDYMPMEGSVIGESEIIAPVDSGQVEIPGLTDVEENVIAEVEEPTVTVQEHYFSEEEGLLTPVNGEVLMHYNMDSTVYFATLDQYKYNPAVIFQAQEGSEVLACADGVVKEIFQNEEIGTALVLDLGNGYEVTYGQLAALYVGVGQHVSVNQVLATVAQPTKYYVVEGSNLYFSMEKDGAAVNPESMFP